MISGNVEAIRETLKQGVNLSDEDDWALRLAMEKSHPIVKDLIDLGDYRKVHPNLALLAFATIGDHSEVARLIKTGADFCSEGHRALREAARHKHSRVIDALVAHYEISVLKDALNEMSVDDLRVVRTRLAQVKAREALWEPDIVI